VTHASGLAPDELVVDLFAGGGGASTGIEAAIGRPVDIAVNHDDHAIAMHAANHPTTHHLCESVFDVDPVAVVAGRPVGLLWASPDCKHFSRAKGGKPREKRIRALAWIVVRWAAAVAPRIVCLENVEEFQTWGPLDEDGAPIRDRAGETFREFVGQLRDLGYAVEWRSLVAADYGAPTTRKRLFLVARRDGCPIVWPTPTHGPGRAPYRTAAECIDWSIPCPSIFGRSRPLADATLRRVAEGIRRYVLGAARPFVVRYHGERRDGERGRVESVDGPLPTVTTENRFGLVAATITKAHSHGWDRNGGPSWPVDEPMRTVTAKDGSALVAAFLAKHYGGVVGQPLDRPIGTVTSIDHHGLVAAHLTKFYGSAQAGQPVDQPAPTVTAGGGRGGGHAALVAAFLCKYYGTDRHGQSVGDPLHTIPTVDRFGLVTVNLDGEEYAIVDIGLRMLQPRELATAQGFAADYRLIGTKTQQVARIGNSVCPPVARAIVEAQLNAPAPKRRTKPVQMPMFRGDQEAA
jgi:DNA (cytosine-5)-methyltransferase 1